MKQVTVVAAIIEKDNKVLCMQRGQDRHDYTSFKWEFPGGKIELGETNEQALTRELSEEMNLHVEINSFFGVFKHEYPDFELTLHVYKCSPIDKDFVLNVHNDFKWLEKGELETLEWAPADQGIVAKYIAE